mgnify:CR=1 FL=1
MPFYIKHFFYNFSPLRNAANNNNQEILYLLMNQNEIEIEAKCFKDCKKLNTHNNPIFCNFNWK